MLIPLLACLSLPLNGATPTSAVAIRGQEEQSGTNFKPGQVFGLEIQRGSPSGIAGFGFDYWAVREAEVQSGSPLATTPNQFVLSTDAKGALLIDFGLLRLMLGPRVKIIDATLVLTSADGVPAKLEKIAEITESWMTPAISSLAARTPRAKTSDPKVQKSKPGETAPSEPEAPRVYGVTWKNRDVKGPSWSVPLFTGGLSPITFTQKTVENELHISGLGSAIQRAHSLGEGHHGFALQFGGAVNFWSSLAKFGRPKLVIKAQILEPIKSTPRLDGFGIENGKVVVRTSGLTKSGQVQWNAPGKEAVTVSVGPENSQAIFDLPKAEKVAGPELSHSVVLIPGESDEQTSDNYLRYYPSGTLVPSTSAAHCSVWNTNLAAQSRYSFAPHGALATFNPGWNMLPLSFADWHVALVEFAKLVGLTQPEGRIGLWQDLYAGIFGFGETRTDVQLLQQMAIPAGPVGNQLLESLQLEKNGDLTISDVQWINQKSLAIPGLLLARLQDAQGRSLGEMSVKCYGFDRALTCREVMTATEGIEVKSSVEGLATLPKIVGAGIGGTGEAGSPKISREFLGRAFAIEVGLGEKRSRYYYKAEQISDLGARGNLQAFVLEARFNLSRVVLNEEVNLASGKSISDSIKSFPAQLVSLVDGKLDAKFDFKGGKDSWIEIDLGRDRTVGAIEIDAEFMPSQYKITALNTGDSEEDSIPWADERNFNWTRSVQGLANAISQGRPVIYFGSPIKIRKIRITNVSGEPGRIKELRVLGPALVASQ